MKEMNGVEVKKANVVAIESKVQMNGKMELTFSLGCCSDGAHKFSVSADYSEILTNTSVTLRSEKIVGNESIYNLVIVDKQTNTIYCENGNSDDPLYSMGYICYNADEINEIIADASIASKIFKAIEK